MTKEKFSNWQLQIDEQDFVWATIDKAESSANSMNYKVLEELQAIIDFAANKKGLVILSRKKSGFIAGADIAEFSKWKGVDDAMAFIERGRDIFNNLAAIEIPTIALINGFCLGGGMELALACKYRIAGDGEKVKLGLPEVKLGIFPGWGGTIRLPRLIGGAFAMEMILSGRAVSAKSAKRMGLVDEVVPERHLLRAAKFYLEQTPKKHKPSYLQQLGNSILGRKVIAWQAKKNLKAKKVNKAHYPAFYAAINHFEQNGVCGNESFLKESQALRPVLAHDTSNNLVRVYGLQERLKSFSKSANYKASAVHVVGAGTMGAEIAAVCALKGINVTLQDKEPQFIAKGIATAYKVISKKLKEPRLINAAMDKICPDVNGLGIAKADIIIEAIFENLQAKQELFKDIEQKAKKDAVLATNTSTFPLAEISSVLKQKERLVGIHFFNPVSQMMLVEVIKDTVTDKTIFSKALGFVGQIDKLALPVKSSPGFLVNRILMPYLMECVDLVDEGIACESIDKAATDFGMPMGPVELADKVGLDVCLYAAESLSKHFPIKIPESLRQKVASKELGIKTNKGFYTYNKGKLVKNSAKAAAVTEDIADRLILRMLNEAVACLREEVVADSDLVDAGMIFGTGFAPFRGGPLHYMHAKGVGSLHERLNKLEKRYGKRFTPDIGWDKLAPNT